MPLFLERLCVLSRRVSEKLKNNSRKLLATVPIALLIVAPSPNMTPGRALSTPAVSLASSDQPEIILAINNPLVVISPKKVSIITPGESVRDREVRIVAEAAAQAAKAKKTAIASQVAVVVSTVPDPTDFKALYNAAGSAFGVSPEILEAIHQLETGKSGSTKRANISGASGPFQFMLATFRAHAVDGNGDGIKSVYNVTDAAFTAARYLHDCGYSTDIRKAIWSYNPSTSYCNRVLAIARSLGFQG